MSFKDKVVVITGGAHGIGICALAVRRLFCLKNDELLRCLAC